MGKLRSALAVVVLAASLGGCWLQPDFDAGRSRWASGETTITTANVDDLVELWDTQVPDAIYLRPAVSYGGSVYVVGATSTGAVVAALDARSGQLRWSRQLSDPNRSFSVQRPAYFDGALAVPYSVGAFSDMTGGLLLLDPATGATLDDQHDDTAAVVDVSVADRALVQKRYWAPASPFGNIRVRIEWTYQTATFDTNDAGGAYAIVGDRIVTTRAFQALGFSSACPPPTPPTPADGCGWDWATDLGPASLGQPVAIGTSQAAFSADNADWATVSVLDVTDGSIQWTWSAPSGDQIGAMAVAGDTLLVHTSFGGLVALPAHGCGAATCQPLWTAPQATWGDPTVGGNVVYVPTSNSVSTFALGGCGQPSCDPLATIDVDAGITGGPIVDDGRVVVGTQDGRVIALGLPT